MDICTAKKLLEISTAIFAAGAASWWFAAAWAGWFPYAPLTAGLLSPIKADAKLECQRRTQLDRLYRRVIDDLDTLVQAVGLKAA
jgi:hypothetical protein